jgi:heme transport system permease protein
VVLRCVKLSRQQSARRLLSGLSLLLPLALLLAVAQGSVDFSFTEVFRGLSDFLLGKGTSREAVITGQIRLPRALLAGLVGAILGISGAAMQGIFRNPLADPSLIGVTAGAALGASIMIALGGSAIAGLSGITLVSLGAFSGGMVAVLVVYRLASSANGTSVATMLLAGIAITALAGAIGNLLELFSSNEILRRISLWRMGGLDGADYQRVWVALVVAALSLFALPRFASALNALLLGESEARYLGINVESTKTMIVIVVAVGVGASVALAGTIAFVGLVIPHIVRMLIGPDHRWLLPASALAGAILLVVADTLARTVLAPTELPVGIITAAIGVPFFISLLRRRGDYGMQ